MNKFQIGDEVIRKSGTGRIVTGEVVDYAEPFGCFVYTVKDNTTGILFTFQAFELEMAGA